MTYISTSPSPYFRLVRLQNGGPLPRGEGDYGFVVKSGNQGEG